MDAGLGLLAVAVSLGIAGCFAPEYGEVAFSCAASGRCPGGYTCVAGMCRRHASDGASADARRDVTRPDAIPPDTSPDLAYAERLAWSCDSDAEWNAAGTLATAKVSGTGAAAVLAIDPGAELSSTRYPSAVTEAGSGKGWTSLDSVKAADSNSAMCDSIKAGSASPSSQQIVTSGYSFAVPKTAVVTGVVPEIHRAESGQSPSVKVYDKEVQLLPGGQSQPSAAAWPQLPGYQWASYPKGSWGLDLTTSVINSAGFGLALQVTTNDAINWHTVYVDAMRLTAYYKNGAGQLTTAPIAAHPSATGWVRLEATRSEAGCSAGAILFDVIRDSDGTALLADQVAPIDLSALPHVAIRVRVRLLAGKASCSPTVDSLRIYDRRPVGDM